MINTRSEGTFGGGGNDGWAAWFCERPEMATPKTAINRSVQRIGFLSRFGSVSFEGRFLSVPLCGTAFQKFNMHIEARQVNMRLRYEKSW
jgi:hypothetical protein